MALMKEARGPFPEAFLLVSRQHEDITYKVGWPLANMESARTFSWTSHFWNREQPISVRQVPDLRQGVLPKPPKGCVLSRRQCQGPGGALWLLPACLSSGSSNAGHTHAIEGSRSFT